MKSNYIVAGFETLASIMHNFMLGKKDGWNDQFTREEISNFLSNTTGGFLHSFGQNFKDKKKHKKYVKQEANMFKICRDMEFFNDSLFYVDSGGYQISLGHLSKDQTKLLAKLYYEFLVDHHDVYDRSFILDVPPGPNCPIFDNFNDVYNYNYNSYTKARNLPKHVKDKMVYVHHFRTPELWRVFTDILNKDDMFDDFKHHATGGIVANIQSDMKIPCIMYVLPLVPLINQAIKYKRKYLDFHVLGGASFRDIYFYELFKKHVKIKHDLDLNITYDSSGLFKGMMIGRRTYLYDGDIIRKVDIRSSSLYLRHRGTMGEWGREDKKVNDFLEEALIDMTTRRNLNPLPKPLKVYDENTGTFNEDVKIYLLLHGLDLYSMVQKNMKEFVDDTYHLYENKNYDEFNRKVSALTRKLNSGKSTSKQKTKTNSIIRSLDMLTDLDEDYCKGIVDKFLIKDEFIHLTDERILTF